MQQPVQDAVDEDLRCQTGQTMVETQHMHPVNQPGGGQKIQLVTQGHQAGRRIVAGKQLARMWLERQQGGGQVAPVRLFTQIAEDGLVPEVDTIKIADGERAGKLGLGNPSCRTCLFAKKNLHESVKGVKRTIVASMSQVRKV